MAANGPSHAPSRCEQLVVRGVRYNLRKWGRDDARPILFLHGTQDSSITFQFVVDQLRGDWCVFAPDWRGHGYSQWVTQGYWFHEFVADLDGLLDSLFPEQAVPIVAHSLGGNIASIFAGLRPDRLSHLVSLDGFGPLVNLVPVDIKQVLGRLLDIPHARREHMRYKNLAAMTDRLMRGNQRLTPEQARFLAENTSVEDDGGGRCWLFDPSHRMSLPSLHDISDWGHIWSDIRVPVLWISSSDSRPFAPVGVAGEMIRRAAMMPDVSWVSIAGSGHNLHHDEPRRVAELLEGFINNPGDTLFARQVDSAIAPIEI